VRRTTSRGRGRFISLWQRADAHGQSMVEFALVVPIFLLLLFGALEMGMLFKTRSAYQEAALQAARAAAAAATTGGNSGENADAQALDALQGALSAENLKQIALVSIYKANPDGSYSTTPHDPCSSTPTCDNDHTYYTYNPSYATTVGQGAFVCSYITPASRPPCTTPPNVQSYWDPLARQANVSAPGGLDRIGIQITFTYRGATGLLPPLHFLETATAQIEPTGY